MEVVLHNGLIFILQALMQQIGEMCRYSGHAMGDLKPGLSVGQMPERLAPRQKPCVPQFLTVQSSEPLTNELNTIAFHSNLVGQDWLGMFFRSESHSI